MRINVALKPQAFKEAHIYILCIQSEGMMQTSTAKANPIARKQVAGNPWVPSPPSQQRPDGIHPHTFNQRKPQSRTCSRTRATKLSNSGDDTMPWAMHVSIARSTSTSCARASGAVPAMVTTGLRDDTPRPRHNFSHTCVYTYNTVHTLQPQMVYHPLMAKAQFQLNMHVNIYNKHTHSDHKWYTAHSWPRHYFSPTCIYTHIQHAHTLRPYK